MLRPNATASTFAPHTLQQVVASSEAVVVATPVAQTSNWQNGRIITHTSLHIGEVLAGTMPKNQIQVRTLGGRVGNLVQKVYGITDFTHAPQWVVCLRHAGNTEQQTAQQETLSKNTQPTVWIPAVIGQSAFPLQPSGQLALPASALSSLHQKASQEASRKKSNSVASTRLGSLDNFRVWLNATWAQNHPNPMETNERSP